MDDAEELCRTSNAEETGILRRRALFLALPQARAVAEAKRQASILPLPPPNVWLRFMRSGLDMLEGIISAGFKALGGGFNRVIRLISNHVKVTVDRIEVEPRHSKPLGQRGPLGFALPMRVQRHLPGDILGKIWGTCDCVDFVPAGRALEPSRVQGASQSLLSMCP